MSEISPPPGASVVPKACESCRTRKVRCNRVIPCSNCLNSGITCRPAKNIEHRPRILVSNNYEKQIEVIGQRLAGIELSLRTLSLPKSRESPHSDVSTDQTSTATTDGPSAPVQFEGLSSFQQQSLQATKLAESLGGKTTEELTNAIESLKDLINLQPETPGASQQLYFTDNRTKLPEVELLPSSFVIAALKKCKGSEPPFSFVSSAIRDVNAFERICQRAYFPTEQLTLGEQTAMFGMFYGIIQEMSIFDEQFRKDYDCEALLQICHKNFSAGIETYEILTVPSHWNIISLFLGASIAMDNRKMSLSVMMSNTACRHALALGYHREATMKRDEPEVADGKRFLFWTLYALDKSLSLTVGRVSCMPDFDIDVEYFQITKNPALRAWDLSALTFVKISHVQGKIYEQLYSASAAKKSSAERAAIIELLAGELHQHQEEMRNIDRTGVTMPHLFDMLVDPSEIIHYSLLTTLYRASTKAEEPEVTSRCFEAARKALEMHLNFFPRFTEGGDIMVGAYVNWILLYCSFTPFVVVFLHSIVSRTKAEVELLEKVAASLERTRFMADDMERLYQTCLVFARVAKNILESHQNLAGTYNEQKDSFIFPDLTNLQQNMMYGSAPNQIPDFFVQQEHGLPPTSNDIGEMSMFFGNWLGSNQPVMDLLNMDLTADVE